MCISLSTILIVAQGLALANNSFKFYFIFIYYHNFFILYYLRNVKNMNVLLIMFLIFGPTGLLQKTTLLLLLEFFIFLMRDCCRDLLKKHLGKVFSTFLDLCPLPIKQALYSFDLSLYLSSVEQILSNP